MPRPVNLIETIVDEQSWNEQLVLGTSFDGNIGLAYEYDV